MLKLVKEETNKLEFYFSYDNNEYDICLAREDMYYLLYLNCYVNIHKYHRNIKPFAKALNELLDVLSYIDNFNEYLDIYIKDGFEDHDDLIECLSLEKQDFEMSGRNVYLVKKGKIK